MMETELERLQRMRDKAIHELDWLERRLAAEKAERELAAAKLLDLERSNALGRIAIALCGETNNVTDAEVVSAAERAAVVERELAAARMDAELRDTLYRNLAGSWLYGNWRAETYSEREQERAMRALGWWPITEDELVARGAAIDAARKGEDMNDAEALVMALEAWIDAKIARERARDSSDGGLIESIAVYELRKEVIAELNKALP